MHKRWYQQERDFPGMPEDDRGRGRIKRIGHLSPENEQLC